MDGTTVAPTRYERVKYTFKRSILDKYWFIFIIILFLVTIVIILVLWCAVRTHFRESDQRKRCQEIEENNGSLKRGLDLGYDKPKKHSSNLKQREKRRVVFPATSREEQEDRQGYSEFNSASNGKDFEFEDDDDVDDDEEMFEPDMDAVMYNNGVNGVEDYQPYPNTHRTGNSYPVEYNGNAFQDPYAAPQQQQDPYAQSYGGPQQQQDPYAQSYGGPQQQQDPYAQSYGGPQQQQDPYAQSYGGPQQQQDPYVQSYGGPQQQQDPYAQSYGGPQQQQLAYGNVQQQGMEMAPGYGYTPQQQQQQGMPRQPTRQVSFKLNGSGNVFNY